MQNKKILFLTSGLLTLIILIFVFYNITNTNNNPIIIGKPSEIEYKDNNIISLMYETGLDTEEYEKSTSNTWPGDDYIFNSALSGCENGGKLSWNQQTNKITLLNNTSDRCYIYFDVYNKAVINNVTNSVTTDSITVNVSATAGENPIVYYFYSINNGEYVSSASNTYTFSGLSAGTNYNIRVYVRDANGVDSNVYTINAETESVVLLADYIKNLYTFQGSNGLYYHTSSLANSAGDSSYRYAGASANVNNYVCFGDDCSNEDNLYRIIGVFDGQVKLIKATSYGSYQWTSELDNTWDATTKPDIYTTLNDTYYNSLGTTWQNKIATHAFKVGGISTDNGIESNAKIAYNYEVGIYQTGYIESMKIGLMYVSDYYYGATPEYWTYPGYNDNNASYDDYSSAIDDNWLYLNSYMWTISRASRYSNRTFSVWNGAVNAISQVSFFKEIHPVFYLNSNVTYVSGTGTSSDPIRIQ